MMTPMMMPLTKRKKRTGPIMMIGLMGLGGLERRSRASRGRRYMVIDVRRRSDVR